MSIRKIFTFFTFFFLFFLIENKLVLGMDEFSHSFQKHIPHIPSHLAPSDKLIATAEARRNVPLRYDAASGTYYQRRDEVEKAPIDSDEEDLSKKTSHLTISTQLGDDKEENSEDENVDLNFFTVGDGVLAGSLSIHGLTYHKDERTYNAMIEEMYREVDKRICKGWHGSHHQNQYKGFSFSNCEFNKDLLVDVGNKLSVYRNAINPSTHFYECQFEKKRLRSVLTKTAEFSKKSTFLNSTEAGERIPNSKH